jgi:hypothetical protein
MKRILDRREHEKTGRVHKVRCFKQRRSRSLHKLTHDKQGLHYRRHEDSKREKRRHRGNKPDPRAPRVVPVLQTVPLRAPQQYMHYYDPHSSFLSIERRL